jgi:UDP-glucuronate decarboxylase
MGGLDWMVASGSRRLFFASTSENYAGGYDVGVVPVPTPEDIPLVIKDITNPRFSYAISKIWGEMATCFYASRYGFSAIIGRYNNVYWPRMGYEHVIPELTRKIVEGPLPVMSPDQKRAFCHVADAVRATHELMNLDTAGATVVHIGDDRQENTIGDLARRLLALAGRPPDSLPLPALGRLRQLIGFEPAVTLDQGLAETFAWYRDHPARRMKA